MRHGHSNLSRRKFTPSSNSLVISCDHARGGFDQIANEVSAMRALVQLAYSILSARIMFRSLMLLKATEKHCLSTLEDVIRH